MKSIQIPNGVLHTAESKAICPHCDRSIPFGEIEPKFNSPHINLKCRCKRYIGITQNIVGDYVAYSLTKDWEIL